MVAVLGYESMGGIVADSQFSYHSESEELKPNYIEGSRKEISTYIMEHFCSPCGTILDVSNDTRGKILTIHSYNVVFIL